MSSFLKSFLDPKKNRLAAMHMNSVSKRLRRYGLRYDDLYDPLYDLDVKEALNRLPREIVDARNQRLKRALDLSLKHEYLPEDLQVNTKLVRFRVKSISDRLIFDLDQTLDQKMQTPFRSYLQDMLALVKERAEREALGALPLV
ncbi:cytochrome b-c1 complex subunit 7-2, mitochondrial-like [Hibiscus syriacus]|uniref:cytochrome b-c1 complex subunit 7-2, mitochondrial-like n=1 Tax=Hibiscus syriacus TaxID=106335 RepID=UPI0019223B41|nr:cytochrome b-c1 complex subunit 7-2, mitochondrial-like [Hibiscus syriacus]XP_039014871.1 cytochrome b-c1 complex subunit 7-2, mitochondrial-like [Hibiscus syriacus]